MLARAVASASSLTSRIAIGSSRRRRKSVASWAAIRPAPTSPIFLSGRGSALGLAGRILRAPLHEVERVEGRLRLAAGQQVGDGLLLRAVALLERPAGERALDQVERAVGGGRRAVHLPVEPRPGFADHLRRIAFVTVSGTVTGL